MNAAGDVRQLKQNRLAARHCHVAAEREAANTVVGRIWRWSTNGVADINVMVRGEVRIDSYADQSALDFSDGGDREGRRCQERAVLDDANIAPLFKNEDATIGSRGQGRCRGKSGGDGRLREPSWQCHAGG